MDTSPATSRRTFIKGALSAASTLGFPAVLRAASPNSMLQVASIGADGMAYTDLSNISQHAKVKYVGFCDVDRDRFAKADQLIPGVPHFTDYRAMLAELGDKVDAVNVGIPDHSHAPAAIAAMQRGKHVYCQKPLAHTVWESRQMRLWAAKAGVVTQMGNQIHSDIRYRLGVKLIQDGAIGKVKAVHSWVGVTGNERTRLLEPPATGPAPANLDWDLWIGTAAMRDFAPGAYHPFVWRDWQDFGGGALGDFGCHILDPVFTALGLTAPRSVVADNSGFNRHVWPVNETVRWVWCRSCRFEMPCVSLSGLKWVAKLLGVGTVPGTGNQGCFYGLSYLVWRPVSKGIEQGGFGDCRRSRSQYDTSEWGEAAAEYPRKGRGSLAANGIGAAVRFGFTRQCLTIQNDCSESLDRHTELV
jgi:predicted dehydrogenase